MMKIAHTADWHLGKKMHNVDLLQDQRNVLEGFIEAMERERPDVILIAGDLFDRSMPSEDAVKLLDWALSRLVTDLNIPVIAIAGNHDSQVRVHYGSGMLRQAGLYIIGEYPEALEPIILRDEYGDVEFYPVPFVEPSYLRHLYDDDSIKTHDDAMRVITERIRNRRSERSSATRQVFIGHAFLTPGGEAAKEDANSPDAERPLMVGGAEYVSSAHFAAFDYAAFGHLHREHAVGSEHIRYSGSPLKYSISEESHQKGWLLVELAEHGRGVTVSHHSLDATHDVRTVRGKLADLVTHAVNHDYVFVKLEDEFLVVNPMGRIRQAYPNAMHLERVAPHNQQQVVPDGSDVNRQGMSPSELFRHFFVSKRKEEVSEPLLDLFHELWNETMKDEEGQN